MAVAAYCSECKGYVWMSAEGSCTNGHPRSCLRDVHEAAELPTPVGVAPASQTPVAVAPVATAPAAVAPVTATPVAATPPDPPASDGYPAAEFPAGGFPAQGDPLTGAMNGPHGYFIPPRAPVNETNTRNIGVRVVAYIIDFVIIAVVQGFVGFAAGFVVTLSVMASGGNPETAAESTAVTLGMYFIGATIFFGYYIIMEATLGWTLGKRVFGLRVVNEDGELISWGQSIARNLMRLVDLLFWGLVGIVSMNTSALRQRLGDRVAGTYVIR